MDKRQRWLFSDSELHALDVRNGVKPDYSYLPRFPNPKNENQSLLECQARWVIDRDQKAWNYLWSESVRIAKKIIKKNYAHRLRGNGDLYDRVLCAVEYVLRRYSTRPGWCVKKNWIAAIYDGCRHSMNYHTKADDLVDFVDLSKLNI